MTVSLYGYAATPVSPSLWLLPLSDLPIPLDLAHREPFSVREAMGWCTLMKMVAAAVAASQLLGYLHNGWAGGAHGESVARFCRCQQRRCPRAPPPPSMEESVDVASLPTSLGSSRCKPSLFFGLVMAAPFASCPSWRHHLGRPSLWFDGC